MRLVSYCHLLKQASYFSTKLFLFILLTAPHNKITCDFISSTTKKYTKPSTLLFLQSYNAGSVQHGQILSHY